MPNENVELSELRGELKKTHSLFMEKVKGLENPLHQTTESIEKMQKDMDAQTKRIDEALLRLNRPQMSADDVKKANRELLRKAMRTSFDGKNDFPAELKTMGIAQDTAGGYLVPEDYRLEIIKALVDFSPVRSVAQVIQTSRDRVKIPVRTTRPSVSKHTEAATNSEDTNIAYGIKEIVPKEYMSIQKISNELMEDAAFNIESELQGDVSFEFAVSEGTDFVSGDGVTEAEGFLTNSTVSAADVSTASSDTFVAPDLITLYHSLAQGYRNNGTWLAHSTVVAYIRKMVSTTGDFLWMPGINGSPSSMLLGRPILECPDMASTPTTDAARIVAFGDWKRGYRIVDRVGLSLLRDPYTSAKSGLVEFIFRKRTGGCVTDTSAIRVLKVS